MLVPFKEISIESSKYFWVVLYIGEWVGSVKLKEKRDANAEERSAKQEIKVESGFICGLNPQDNGTVFNIVYQ